MILAGYLPVSAQSADKTILYIEGVVAMKKKAMILQYLDLTEAEKASFWPLYNQYCRETLDLDREYIHLLTTYAKGIDNLPKSKLRELSQRSFENEVERAKIRRHYFRKFKRALSLPQAVKFMQLDEDFRSIIRLDPGFQFSLNK